MAESSDGTPKSASWLLVQRGDRVAFSSSSSSFSPDAKLLRMPNLSWWRWAGGQVPHPAAAGAHATGWEAARWRATMRQESHGRQHGVLDGLDGELCRLDAERHGDIGGPRRGEVEESDIQADPPSPLSLPRCGWQAASVGGRREKAAPPAAPLSPRGEWDGDGVQGVQDLPCPADRDHPASSSPATGRP
ncbi:hypothetical protein OsI_18769 [Oryza sativa Indica Group]|uniref:Uncharacterized protein n=1 Tax=Oryza sativa subsp. indica TaxID=39946 RepID=B8AYX1_ORYSI|nr:hypothetical protein OsI_18769 [Oryza sativa Indica Group]